MGFSQGAAVCYDLLLNSKYIWGGIFPVAGFLRDSNKVIKLNKAKQSIPVIIGHGKKDDIIPIAMSEKVYNLLFQNNANVNFIKYNGAHKISREYLKNIRKVVEHGRKK